MEAASLDPALLHQVQSRQPLLWLNPKLGSPLPAAAPPTTRIAEAEARLARFAPLMATLFPELEPTGGHIESQLMPAAPLRHGLGADSRAEGAWFIKRDDVLPVAGSIKARGGFHEVLALAESIAIEQGLLGHEADPSILSGTQARNLFAQYSVSVGSTGNLGLSIGVMAAALGFDAVVHMSADAKAWKKERLRKRGVRVVEHAGDYAEAVAAGRREALKSPRCYFVDDERSERLFFGYAAAARYLARQLCDAGRVVNASHPLFVYLPCGVGGAPGGITFGLKALFGEHVHCFFAEPVASPCVLVQLASGSTAPLSVYDIGLDNRTDADGLAVGQASMLVSPLMTSQLSGILTVPDDQLYAHLLALKTSLDVEIEPSAAAAIAGPLWLCESAAGRAYVHQQGLDMRSATHVIWTTGGSLVPPEEHRRFRAHAEGLAAFAGIHA
ncbi:D-serine ammonia-lyase [Paraburkholderia guartelaensis]|uniref:D-serine ammonia-lyase n=1 Tax=Paraburkholderia guartelaensis TaxID=2546446 RepID=UPI0038BAC35E